MLQYIEIENYRSLRDFRMECGRLNVITGPNGSGKTNLYRALQLMRAMGAGGFGRAIAAEGGMASALWGGPRAPRSDGGSACLRVRAVMAPYSYEFEAGVPPKRGSLFDLVPAIRKEIVWAGSRRPAPSHVVAKRIDHQAVLAGGSGRRTVNLARSPGESMLSLLRDPREYPALAVLRDRLSGWRFYHQFRSDAESPLRQPRAGTWVSALAPDGADLVSAIASISESPMQEAFAAAVDAAFPGCSVDVIREGSVFFLTWDVPALRRRLSAGELSDGTLRYLALAAALLSPVAAEVLVLNEPESSLHPGLLTPLADLIARASERSQVWVITHSDLLAEELGRLTDIAPLHLQLENGRTVHTPLTPALLGVIDDSDDARA